MITLVVQNAFTIRPTVTTLEALNLSDLKGETTILLLWEVPNHHILETLTSTDKLLHHVCSMGNVYKILSHNHIWQVT